MGPEGQAEKDEAQLEMEPPLLEAKLRQIYGPIRGV